MGAVAAVALLVVFAAGQRTMGGCEIQLVGSGRCTHDSSAASGAAGESGGRAYRQDEHGRIVVYYVHGNIRCTACLNMEAYTEEVLKERFSQAIDRGFLLWKPINVDLPQNAYFIEEFDVPNQSVVLVEKVDGKAVRWMRLEHTWDFVDDKETYKSYVADKVERFMEHMD